MTAKDFNNTKFKRLRLFLNLNQTQFAYWNRAKSEEIQKQQNELNKKIEDKEAWDRLHKEPDRGSLLPY